MKKFSCFVFLIFLGACSSGSKKTEISVNEEYFLKSPIGQTAQNKKSGETFVLEEAALIESPGKVSVLVVPLEQKAQKLDLALKDLESWRGAEEEKKVNIKLGSVSLRTREVEILLASGNKDGALQQIRQLRTEFPYLTYLAFLETSCLLVAGQKDAALESLKVALKDFPDYEGGRKLYKELSGAEYIASEKIEKKESTSNLEGGAKK